MSRSLWIVALAGACASEPTGAPAPTAAPDDRAPAGPEALEPLDPPRLLRRISLDLRGHLPSPEELASATSPEAALREGARYMRDPAFEDRMVELLAEHWWTRVEVFDVIYQDYGFRPEQEFAFEASVGEEPLRVVAHIIAEDQPWSEVTLSETTRANSVLADIWPLEFTGAPPEPGEWADARYVDGRPSAGVLSTNGLWWRYITTDSNMNRGRAAALSRLLLCEDYLSRPITFSAADTAVADPEQAIKTDPYCMACHASLDPVAASLFGFWWLSLYSRIEEDRYHPERESLAEDMIGESPAWYGQPMSGLADLGAHVARDPRTYSCAVETFAKLLWRRPVTPDDRPTLDAVRDDFLAAEARPQALLEALIATPQYQAAGVVEGARASVDLRENTARMLSPAQLQAIGTSLVDLEWRRNGFEQLRNDEVGYRVLAGGVDGLMLTEPQRGPGLPWALVTQRTAQAIADLAVRYELEEGAPDYLLRGITLQMRPGDDAFRDALGLLWWRMTAIELADDDAEALEGLWSAVYDESGDPAQAWRATFSVILRDPLFLSY